MSDFLAAIGLTKDDLTDGREIRCDRCNNVVCYMAAEIHALFILCPKCFGEEKK